MFGSILFRMILWELSKIFLLSLAGITGILLMAGIIAEASQQGLGPGQILAAIPLLVPSTLPYTIPATTLFAACIVYGRLAADNEILAIKAAGVNLVKVVNPGLILGVAMSLCTMGLYFNIIPYTHALLRAMVFHDLEELLYSMLRKNGTINYPQMSYAMFVKGVQGRKLINPTFKKRGVKGEANIVAQAKEAELKVLSRVVDGVTKRTILIHMRYGVVSSEDGSRAYFEDRVWEMELPDHLGRSFKRPRDLTWTEMLERRSQVLLEDAENAAQLDLVQRQIDTLPKPTPAGFEARRKDLYHRHKFLEIQLNEIYVELLMRPALSVGCLCFILVGCPVGIWFSRSDFLSSFITCFVPIVIVYYPLVLCGTNMAKEGRLPQIPLVWAANIVVGTVGLVLFGKLLRN